MVTLKHGINLVKLSLIGERREVKKQRNSYKNGRKISIELRHQKHRFLTNVLTFLYFIIYLG